MRLIAETPSLIATYHRMRTGQELVPPHPTFTQAANFLWMLHGEEPDQADADHDGVADACKDRCLGTVIPETAPTHGLKPLHYALVDGDLVFDTVPPTFGLTFDTTDTAGCSCEQIVAKLHLGNGHKKHGCNVAIMGIWTLLVK